MEKLEDLDTDDDLKMPGSSTSYKSINYKSKGQNNSVKRSKASSVMTISDYDTTD